MLGDNIKVHFAGSDGQVSSYLALLAADVHYQLYSCYKYIYKQDSNLLLPDNHIIKEECNNSKHVIQDSGLFTLMFGAAKGKKLTLQYLTEWQDRLIQFVTQNNLQCTCVEVDCQKVLGVEEAWILRKRMRDKLPNRQINVFHYEDGKDGLDKLIDFSEYIAISVPELRIVKPKSYKSYVSKLARYIKKKKPNIDIHLLGCTEFKLLEENTFCTSADSTSWLQGVKYGHINDGVQIGHIKHFKKDIFNERLKTIEKMTQNRGVEITGKYLEYTTNASLCASICKSKYERSAGNQD